MLRKELVGKMDEEFRMLWEISQRKNLNPTLTEMVKREIGRVRKSVKSKGVDLLEEKLNSFGNTGVWGRKRIQSLARAIYSDKRPDNVNLGDWISVEIETVFQSSDAETQFVAFVRKHGFGKQVTLKTDGSIRTRGCECETYYDDETEERIHEDNCLRDSDNSFGKEIVITFKFGDFNIVTAICDKLNSLGCTVNKSCGLHVHFDMRQCENTRQVGTIGQRLAKVVPALKQMLPASRMNNQYCEQTINTMRGSGRGLSRYSFVNLQAYKRHKTLEVRGHSGTTDALKIINWIRILRTVMAKPNRQEVGTITNLLAKFNFDDDLAKYIAKRADKFKSKNPVTLPAHDDVSDDNLVAQIGQGELDVQIDTGVVGQIQTMDSVA